MIPGMGDSTHLTGLFPLGLDHGVPAFVCDLTYGTVDLSGGWERNLNLIVGKGLDNALVQVINTFEKASVIRVMPHEFQGEVVAEFRNCKKLTFFEL